MRQLIVLIALAVAALCRISPAVAVAGNRPSDNPIGRVLFADTRMSRDGDVACATCHRLTERFVDGRATAQGTALAKGSRNTPSLLAVKRRPSLAWEGRREHLEEFVLDPLTNPIEHGFRDLEAVAAKLESIPEYARRLPKSKGKRSHDETVRWLADALAAYVRSLDAAPNAFDRYREGEAAALSPSAQRGLAVFEGKARCAECHLTTGPRDLTDEGFHRSGVGLAAVATSLATLTGDPALNDREHLGTVVATRPDLAELGRFLVTRNPKDIGKFRTPGLRNVARTGPYMHNGSVATLQDAVRVELYYRTTQGAGILLSAQDRADLMAFLQALDSDAIER